MDKDKTSIFIPEKKVSVSGLKGYSPVYVDESQTYLSLKVIASGGFGTVSRGFDVRSRGFVAIKKIKEDMLMNEMVMDSFEREIDIVFKLSHHYIVKAFAHPRGIIIYDYIKGTDLKALLYRLNKEGLILPLDISAYIISSVAMALEYAYNDFVLPGKSEAERVVHRDISPQNIMLAFDTGEPKLTDFGIAKAKTKASEASSLPGTVKGKPHYMSPEHARAGEIDNRTDIFALGLIFYEALTGVRAITGTTEAAFEKAKKWQLDMEPLKKADIKPEIKDIILKMLARNKEERFSSGREINLLLNKYYTHDSQSGLKKVLGRVFKKDIEAMDKEMAFEVKNIEVLKSKALENIPESPTRMITPSWRKWVRGISAAAAVAAASAAGIYFFTAGRNNGNTNRPAADAASVSAGTIEISSIPPGAEVYTKSANESDFSLYPLKTPCSADFNPDMRIKLKLQGFEELPPVIADFSKDGKINSAYWNGSKTGKDKFSLKGVFYKKMKFETVPEGAKIFIDGKDAKKITPAEISLPAGAANVRFEKEKHRPETAEVKIDADAGSVSRQLWRKVVFKVYSQETKKPVSVKVTTEYFNRTGSAFEEFIPYGKVALSVSKSNYRTKKINVSNNGHSENIYIKPVYPEITVTVKNSRGAPVSAAFVKLGTKQNISRVEGMTDSGGRWKKDVSALNKLITVGRAGYETKSKAVKLKWGKNKNVNFVLERVFSGSLIVDPRGYKNGAEIYIDGKKQKYTQFLMTNIAGRKKIRVEWPAENKSVSKNITVNKDGEKVIVKFTQEGEIYVEKK